MTYSQNILPTYGCLIELKEQIHMMTELLSSQVCLVMAKVGNSIGVSPPDHSPAQPAQSKHNQY